MKNRRLIAALGLAVLLLASGSIVGCSPVQHGQSTNPMEEMENPSQGGSQWTGELSDIPGFSEEPPAAGGITHKVTATTFDLEVPTTSSISMQSSSEGETEIVPGAETKTLQVVFNPDMKVYKLIHHVGMDPELEEISKGDIEDGRSILVWGEKSGERLFADTIVILG